MARFRLRFLLQEFDLVGPEVVIGRSPDCHITIEDPLLSRRHALLKIEDDDVQVVDLNSRNGILVNGRRIRSATGLNDGDRLRLGTQELVFYVARRLEPVARPTGMMRMCGSCRTPYPEGAEVCPHCGVRTVPPDDVEETISGLMIDPRPGFALQLLSEVIERTLQAARFPEAERMLRRASKEIDERLRQGDRLEAIQVHTFAVQAIVVAREQRVADWVSWALTLYKRHMLTPSDGVIGQLETLGERDIPGLTTAVSQFVDWWRAEVPRTDEIQLRRLEELTEGENVGT